MPLNKLSRIILFFYLFGLYFSYFEIRLHVSFKADLVQYVLTLDYTIFFEATLIKVLKGGILLF